MPGQSHVFFKSLDTNSESNRETVQQTTQQDFLNLDDLAELLRNDLELQSRLRSSDEVTWDSLIISMNISPPANLQTINASAGPALKSNQ